MGKTGAAHVVDIGRGHNNSKDLELTNSSNVGEDEIREGNNNCNGDEVSKVVKSIEEAFKKVTSLPSNCSIYRVPEPLRKIKPEAYTPRMVSIGPFHRGKIHLKPMEAHKLRYLFDFINRKSHAPTLHHYVKAMTDLEDKARGCYSEIIKLKPNKFVEMMLMDGCFILELVLRTNLNEPRRKDEPILNATWMSHVIKCDLLQLENQLPFFVLEKLYELTEKSNFVNGVGPPTFSHHAHLFLGDFVQPSPSNTSKGSIFKVPEIVHHCVQVITRYIKKDQSDVKAPLLEEDDIEDKEMHKVVGEERSRRGSRTFTQDGHNRKEKEISEDEHEENSPAKRDKERSVEDHTEENSGPMHLLDFVRTLLLPSPSGTTETEEQNRGACSMHLLHFVCTLLLRSPSGMTKTKKQNRGEFAFTRSATELNEASVKFEKGPTKYLLDIKFNNGVMKIPPMRIEDWTESLFRNLIAFEQSHNVCPQDITYYAAFIDGLVNSPKDVELLQKQGIIESLLGEPEEVAALFNGLLKEVIIVEGNYYYSSVCSDVGKYYKIRRHKWKASLMHNYCNTPWAFLSFLAAVILLILTVAQTICSIIQVT